MLNALHSLVDKSMAMVEHRYPDKRYRSLDSIHRSAVDLLDAKQWTKATTMRSTRLRSWLRSAVLSVHCEFQTVSRAQVAMYKLAVDGPA